MLVAGFDPGGKGNNGIALISDSEVRCATVDDARIAFRWLEERAGHDLVAIGIDTFLHWEFADHRPCDTWLRKRYTAVPKSVLHVNSTYGSMVVQGAIFGIEARKFWPSVVLNESHPKVLHYALTGRKIDYAQPCLEIFNISINADSEHATDALIAAAVTRRALLAPQDYHDLCETASNPTYPAGDAFYWWPN